MSYTDTISDMFATVDIAGKQYIVAPGEDVIVDHIDGNVGDSVTFDKVLLFNNDKETFVGKPYVEGKKVTAKIKEQQKGEKLHVRRYKQKVRYRRTIGFRALETVLSIEKIA